MDPRSDIYSLGVLLYESLAGQIPPADEKESRALLHRANPLVGRGLEDLLHKCLAQDRESRYADAGELAADLRRHVANLPLRGVANRGLKERWQKWRRRKPHSLSTWTVSLTALVVIGGACAFFYTDRLQAARSALRQAEQYLADGDHTSALERLTTGLHAIRWLPGHQDLRQSFQSQLMVAQRARVIGALHHLVEQLRFLENVEDVPSGHAARTGCWLPRDLGSQRPDCRERAGSSQGPRKQRRDRPAGPGPAVDSAHDPRSRRERFAVGAVEGFESHRPGQRDVGTVARLGGCRAQLAGQQVSSDPLIAQLSTDMPRAAWEHDAVGRMLFEAGKLEQAREIFKQAIQLGARCVLAPFPSGSLRLSPGTF